MSTFNVLFMVYFADDSVLSSGSASIPWLYAAGTCALLTTLFDAFRLLGLQCTESEEAQAIEPWHEYLKLVNAAPQYADSCTLAKAC